MMVIKMYIKVQPNGEIINPFSVRDLKREFPNVSFPLQIPVTTLAAYSVYELIPSVPPQYDPVTHKLVEDTPVRQKARNEDGTWKADDPNTPENEAWEYVQVWKLEEYTPEEVAANVAKYNADQESVRSRAYRNESDPIFFKWQRGEATEQEWLDKIAEIKAAYPDYQE